MTSPPPTLQELTRSVYRQLAMGMSRSDVMQQLIARGWPEVTAQQFVTNAAQSVIPLRPEDTEEKERQYMAKLLRRRAALDLLLTAVCALGSFVAFVLVTSLHALAFFFLSMGILSLIDLLLSFIGWWHIRH